MLRISLPAALAPIAAVWTLALMAAPAALAGNCAEMRASIVRMDRESVKPPGYAVLRRELLHQAVACQDTARPDEYWYRADGTPTGALASTGRPDGAAYAATAEIGAACARSPNPGICALDAQVATSCRTPQPESRTVCQMLFGEDYAQGDGSADKRKPVPRGTSVTLDGRTYDLNGACTGALYDTTTPDMQANPNVRTVDLELMKTNCPDFLAALERRTGRTAARDPAGFWPALGELVLGNFPPPGAQPATVGSINADPGFRRMCDQAAANETTCRQRQGRMGAVGTISTSRELQAGDFGDCADLYGKVARMCRNTQAAAARPPAPPPAAPAKAAAAPKPSSGQSAPPPAQPQMSAQCQALVADYVGAAQANDGPRAVAGYNALKKAGGCGVLDKVDRPPPATAAPAADDPRFAARGSTPLSDQVVGNCDASPAECAARVRQLQAGTSPEAKAALMTNAIGIGLQLGAMMGGAVLSAVPAGGGGGVGGSVGGGGTNMNSIGNRPVRSTYGQGAPTYQPAPQQRPSDITGTK